MYFTINMAFTNYLDMLPNLSNPSLIKDRTTYEQPLPVNLSIPVFDSSLNYAPTNLKKFHAQLCYTGILKDPVPQDYTRDIPDI